jgi:hypothetical protein
MMEYQMGFMAMPGLGFFGLLLVGLIAGYVAERAMNRDHGLSTSWSPSARRRAAPMRANAGRRARHDDDHGRDLHPRLHLLQRGHGAAQDLDVFEPGPRGRCGAEAGAEPRGHHLGRPRRPRRWRGGAFRHDHPRDPQTRARHHDRDPDARFPEMRRQRAWRSSSRRNPMSSTTISKPCPASTSRSGPARATSIPCGCCSG